MRDNKKYLFNFVVALIIAALAAVAASATGRGSQEKTAQQPAPVSQPTDRAGSPAILISPDEDYRIGPRDVIEIQVEKAPELSGTWNLSASGTFLMPYLGRISALDKTPEELAAIIAGRLRGDYLKDPRVKVAVKQYNSRSFFIQGAVRSPGVYQIEGQASLLKLIILAGGLADNHGSSAFIIREVRPDAEGQRSSDQSSNSVLTKQVSDKTAATTDSRSSKADAERVENYELIQVNINGLLRGHFDQNMMIEPGDIINIPPTDVFFVAGEVRSPGSFPLKEGTTLRQAISLAQGTTFKAAASRAIIFREEPGTGKRQDMKIDVEAVMKGKQQDVPIMANDVIIIPNSRMKSVSSALLTAFGMHAVVRGLPY